MQIDGNGTQCAVAAATDTTPAVQGLTEHPSLFCKLMARVPIAREQLPLTLKEPIRLEPWWEVACVNLSEWKPLQRKFMVTLDCKSWNAKQTVNP